MQVSIEASEGLNRQLKISVPAKDFNNAMNQEVRKYSKTHRMQGFRPGHVPVSVIKRTFGSAILEETVRNVINATLYPAIQQAQITNLANSAPRFVKYETVPKNGECDFVYVAEVEVLPDVNFDVKPLEEVELKKISSEVTDANVDRMIDTLREQQGKWNVVDREANNHDLVSVSFEGFKDGQPVPNTKIEGNAFRIFNANFLPGFAENFLGKKAGDEFEFNYKYPETYSVADLANQEILFKAKVTEVKELVLPEIDEAFIKNLGIDGGVDDLKAEVKKNMLRQLDQSVNDRNLSSIFNTLVDTYGSFELPQRLYAQAIDATLRRYKLDPEKATKEHKDAVANIVSSNLKRDIIVSQLAIKYDIHLDNARVDKYIDDISTLYENSAEYVATIKKNSSQMSHVRDLCFSYQVADFLFSKCKVTEEHKDFYEIVR